MCSKGNVDSKYALLFQLNILLLVLKKGEGFVQVGGYLRGGGNTQNTCCEGQKRRQHTKALDLLVGSLASEFEL